MIANAVNLASFANVLCHLDTTPLSVAVLAPCAWGENLACGGAWQSVLLGRNGAWQGVVNLATHNTAQRGEFGNKTAKRGKIQRHSNKIQRNEFIKTSTANGTHSTTNSIKYGEFGNANNARQIRLGKCGENGVCRQNKAWRHCKFSTETMVRCLWTKQKWGSVWAGDFSLSLSLVSQLFICVLFFQFFKSLCSFSFAFKAKIHKFYLFSRLARNDSSSCHFKRSDQAACKAQAAAKNPHSVFSVPLSVFCVDTSLRSV